ncbi:hypothetical protein [Parafrankia sp. BMG5.11]|uniref:hypothetical protein n=1 Tax=Parafrankia sp. BMG5.11 TaxID=222540 RepID=UPI00103FDD6A|nr:hypothetical protein [Parafrankia sp. BMG5.11]TCJ36864.1 hypothetical protein E0504_21545 [Parafrankia sp. BMG5.11]
MSLLDAVAWPELLRTMVERGELDWYEGMVVFPPLTRHHGAFARAVVRHGDLGARLALREHLGDVVQGDRVGSWLYQAARVADVRTSPGILMTPRHGRLVPTYAGGPCHLDPRLPPLHHVEAVRDHVQRDGRALVVVVVDLAGEAAGVARSHVTLTTSRGDEVPAALVQLDPAYNAAYVWLHELGHLVDDDVTAAGREYYADAVRARLRGLPDVTLDELDEVAREAEADRAAYMALMTHGAQQGAVVEVGETLPAPTLAEFAALPVVEAMQVA